MCAPSRSSGWMLCMLSLPSSAGGERGRPPGGKPVVLGVRGRVQDERRERAGGPGEVAGGLAGGLLTPPVRLLHPEDVSPGPHHGLLEVPPELEDVPPVPGGGAADLLTAPEGRTVCGVTAVGHGLLLQGGAENVVQLGFGVVRLAAERDDAALAGGNGAVDGNGPGGLVQVALVGVLHTIGQAGVHRPVHTGFGGAVVRE